MERHLLGCLDIVSRNGSVQATQEDFLELFWTIFKVEYFNFSKCVFFFLHLTKVYLEVEYFTLSDCYTT